MQTQEIIFNLNKALQLEYSDVFLYPREARLIQDKDKQAASIWDIRACPREGLTLKDAVKYL